jgi:2-amino-4-hydroxy-6-hydroxymethyldihydropteridine diphosphokinase
MYRVFLGLGSDLGDRLQYLDSAIAEIGLGMKIKAISAVYKSAPYGMTTDCEFLNIAVEIATPLEPRELLDALKYIEKKLGRSPQTHMKDREIDIDILLYENFYYEEHALHSLEVPHPDLHNRRFALLSLNEIASDVLHPIYGRSVHVLLQQCPDKGAVERTALRLEHSSSLT